MKIAATREEELGKWLFLSDNVKEVRAAREAGMQSYVVVREGNAVLTEQEREGQVSPSYSWWVRGRELTRYRRLLRVLRRSKCRRSKDLRDKRDFPASIYKAVMVLGLWQERGISSGGTRLGV